MKLIIDIPEDKYKNALSGKFHTPTFYEAIQNGIPLDKIKAEIEEEINEVKSQEFLTEYDNGKFNTLVNMIILINKHIGDTE